VNKQEYPEYITKQDVLKFMDISIRDCQDPHNACKVISNKIKEEFNKGSEVKILDDNFVVKIDSKDVEFENRDLYVVPNIKNNRVEKRINATVIQSSSI
jgi:hypothetical protein